MYFQNLLLSLPAAVLCASCGISSPNAPASCPTPATEDSVNLWPKLITDRDLLSDSTYISKMIQHGSNSNLKAIVRKSESRETFGAIKAEDLSRVKSALIYRQANKCADVPDYLPYYSTLPVLPLQ